MSELTYNRGSPVPASGGPASAQDEGLGVYALRFVTAVLRNRWTVIVVALVTVLLAIAWLFASGRVSTRTYTASAAFAPQGRSSAVSGLTGIAAQLGVAAPAGDPALSPAFYSELIRSHALLQEMVETRYVVPGLTGTEGSTLIELYGEGRDEAARERAINRLSGNLSVGTNMRTNIVRVGLTASDPALAQALTNRLLELVNEFNLERRRSQAMAERQFTEKRLAEVREDLRIAENRMQEFLWRNREYRSDPTLAFTYDRLAREVALRQQLVGVMSQAYEQAKIDQVRDTPVITVVERPYRPVYPNGRGLVRSVMTAGFIGLFLGIALALLRSYLKSDSARHQPVLAEFAEIRQDMRADVRRAAHALRLTRKGGEVSAG